MRHFLLAVMAMLSVAFMANAAISDEDTPPVFNSDRSVSDPNGHTSEEAVQFLRDYIQTNYISRNIPSPLDADYYLDLLTENKFIPLYYDENEGCYEVV